MNQGRGRRGRGGGGGGPRRGLKDGGGRSVMRRGPVETDEGRSPTSSGCFAGLRRGFLVRGGGGRNLGTRMGLPLKQRGNVWRKVVVQRGRNYGKDWLLRELEEQVQEQIFPVHFKYDGPNLTFLLDDLDKVEAIRPLSRRFEHPGTGNKVVISVEKAEPPYIDIPPHEVMKLKEVLRRRLDPSQAHLDLSGMSFDRDLQVEDISAGLYRANYMMTIVKLIGQNCPNIVSLDVSNNRLRFLDYFATLLYRARNIKRLNLANNQIDRIGELEKLKGWQVVDLELDGNPLCGAFNDIPSYTNAIHSVFPKVTRLDGQVVEAGKELDFPLDEETLNPSKPAKRLPPILPGFTVNEEVKKQLETFVVEFVRCYDDGSPTQGRQKLQPAYDEAAVFTLIMEGIIPGCPRYGDTGLFQDYRQHSHNIAVKERWENYRHKVVTQGNLMVVAKLCSLPRTKHLLDTFVLDVSLLNPPLIIFALHGLFWDGAEAEAAQRGEEPKDPDQLRFFHRSFVVSPRGEGLVIHNDSLLVSSAGKEARNRYVANLQASIANVEAAATVAAPPAATAPQPTIVSGGETETREALIARFAQASGMQKVWAEKCLADNHWNFDVAAQQFQVHRDTIPAEAFA